VRSCADIPRGELARYVPRGPAVDHVRRLREAGYTTNQIARAAGVHHTSLAAITSESRDVITERVEALLLSVAPEADADTEDVAA
jgi:DNA-binding XRE family transcriptional regulator